MSDVIDFKRPAGAVALARPSSHHAVARPRHYIGAGGLETRHVIRDWGLGFELGNVVKYILRHQSKQAPIQDLEKARQYLVFAREAVIAGDELVEWWFASRRKRLDPVEVGAQFGLTPPLIEALLAVLAAANDAPFARAHIENAAASVSREIVRLQAAVCLGASDAHAYGASAPVSAEQPDREPAA